MGKDNRSGNLAPNSTAQTLNPGVFKTEKAVVQAGPTAAPVAPTAAPAQPHPLEAIIRRIFREEMKGSGADSVGIAASTPVSSSIGKTIVLDDLSRQTIERLSGGVILTTSADVVSAFTKLTTFNISNLGTLELPHDWLVRLESRVPMDTDAAEWVQSEFFRFIEMVIDGAL